MVLPDYALRDFEELIFRRDTLAKIRGKIELKVADVLFSAEDDQGGDGAYPQEGEDVLDGYAAFYPEIIDPGKNHDREDRNQLPRG